MEELLAAAAAALNAPEGLVHRSAEARAKASGSSVDAVLRLWAGAEAPAAATPAPAAAAEPPSAAPAPAAAAPSVPAAAGPIDWAAVAQSQGMPEKLLRRSVEAKAAKSGRTPEEIVAEMTGRPVAAAPTPAAPETPAAPVAAPADEPPAAPVRRESPAVEVLGPDPETSAAPAPPSVDSQAGPARSIPRWLVAAFWVIPAFAVLYALFLPNGPNCGDAGALAVDPVTGLAVNCDGTEYGVEVVDYFAMGERVYGQCSSCHGDNGGGGGNFPAFTGGVLLATFPEGTCSEQVEWVRLGSAGWPEATYGATAKPVGGSGANMPAFGGVLDEEELRAVVLYERVQFAGVDLDAAQLDCGLVETDGEAAAGE